MSLQGILSSKPSMKNNDILPKGGRNNIAQQTQIKGKHVKNTRKYVIK